MFLRFNLRLKIGLIIFKVNSNYIKNGTWLAALMIMQSPFRAWSRENDTYSRRLPSIRNVILLDMRGVAASR